MTRPLTRPTPQPISRPEISHESYTLCLHCGRAEVRSAYRPGWCRVCAPDPTVTTRLAAEVSRRHIASVMRAKIGLALAEDIAGHAWVGNPGWSVVHLFAVGEDASYCTHVHLARPAVAAPPYPGKPECRHCRALYAFDDPARHVRSELTSGATHDHSCHD